MFSSLDVFKALNSEGTQSDLLFKSENLNLNQLIGTLVGEIDLAFRFYLLSFKDLGIITSDSLIKLNRERVKFYFKNNRNEEKLNKEECMNELALNLGVPVDVAIGNLNLSISDLIAIEKGDFIKSNLPKTSEISLMIAGEVIATADFSIEGEEILLKINKTFLVDSILENDNNL